jgi:hypothetical protein
VETFRALANRADIHYSHRFLIRFATNAAGLVVLLLLGGLASAFALLRAQDLLFRWMGTAICWTFGVYVLGCSIRGFREKQ